MSRRERRQGPGKAYRKGMTLFDAVKLFGEEEIAERWFIDQRWPSGVACVRCGSMNIAERPTRKPQPFRCRDCRKDFSVTTGTVMHQSHLPLKAWGLAIYIVATGIKGTSSMKLYRDLGVTQKTAWLLGHRIRKIWEDGKGFFDGPVEVDETYIGGKEKNKHANKRRNVGAGAGGKEIVVAVKDRATNQLRGQAVPDETYASLRSFVERHAKPGAMVYSDEHRAYQHFHNLAHRSVSHSAKEYVRGPVHVNSVESFWALLKRGYHGTYHHLSGKHLDRYVNEFAGRSNQREHDTIDQLGGMVRKMDGKRLKYRDLIGPPETRRPKMI